MSFYFKNDLDLASIQSSKYFEQLLREEIISRPIKINSNINDFKQSLIIEVLDKMHAEATFINSIKCLAQMVYLNPNQVLTFIKDDDFNYIMIGLRNPETNLDSIIILYYITQCDFLLLHFYNFIEKNEESFFNTIKAILKNSDSEKTQCAAILFLQSLSTLKEARPLLIKYEIFLVLNKLANKNDDVDYCISFFYCYVADFSFGEYTQDFFDSIFPLLYNFCQHKNLDIIPFPLKSLRLLISSSPLPFEAIMSFSMINIFVKYINLLNYPKIQQQAIDILNSCISYQDFPVELIFTLNIIESIFNSLQSNDESIISSSIKSFDKIFKKCGPANLPKAVSICSQYEFLNYFSSQPYEEKVNVIDLFDILIQYSPSENAHFLCSEKNIEFLLDILLSSDYDYDITSKVARIFDILISHFGNNQNFISFFLPLIEDSGCIDFLNHNLEEMTTQTQCCDSIIVFLKNVHILEQSFDVR